MKLMLILLATLTLPACGNKRDKEGLEPPQPVAEPTKPTPNPAPDPATEAADFITVLGDHKEKKADDPVQVHFKNFTVTKAELDPQNLEGGSATIEIDLASFETGKPQRDKHLASPDYLNVEKFAKLTIDVSNVKKQDGAKHTADAKVTAMGVDKTYPVTFEVVEAKDDWVRIRGEHTFPRTDFNIGKDPADDKESVARDLTIKLQLTLKKT
jgi:polyisoprenoid-binding protein YceI